MCGRYELHTNPAAIALAFDLALPPALAPRYNIAPMQQVPIVRKGTGGANECVEVKWGFVPRWARDPSIGARLVNARAETVAQRGIFRNAFRRHRCLLPADGFYEWKKLASGKQPVRVAMKSGEPFALAGLYERWLSRDGEVLDTCIVLTVDASAMLRGIHDRMPVIIAPEHYARWLDSESDDVGDLLSPYRDDAITWHRVSNRVNTARNDDPSLIVPLEGDESPDAGDEQAGEPAPVQTSLL